MEPLSDHNKKIKIIKDKYRKIRGGYSKLLKISCSVCKNEILIYQKDGPGILRRMYIDRIRHPEHLKQLGKKHIQDIQSLQCKICKKILAYPYIYKKEQRKAFKIILGSIAKETYDTHTFS